MVFEVLAQPLLLSRSGSTAAHVGAFAVQNNNVPPGQIVAVVALPRIARSGSKVVDVPGCTVIVVLVVSGSRARTIFESPPSRPVAFRKLLIAAIWIRQVSGSEYCAWNVLDELGSSVCPRQVVTTCDVTGSHQHSVLLCYRKNRKTY